MTQRLLTWWSGPALERVWRRIADRLERTGLQAAGRVQVSELDRTERHAVSDLLGRPVTTVRVQIDLAALDTRLRSRAGIDLVTAATKTAGPLTDRPAHRAAQAELREAPRAAYDAWRDQHPDVSWPWLPAWFEGLRSDGLLGRAQDSVGLVTSALEVLLRQRAFVEQTSGEPPAPAARTELAVSITGDAHALDDDRPLTGVVLRAVHARDAHDHGVPSASYGGAEVEPPSRRALWERIGVVADTVSSTCLTLGLALTTARGDDVRSTDPTHLSWWDLKAGLTVGPGQDVLVCENPRVLEAAAEHLTRRGERASAGGTPRGAPHVGLVCTSGRPALVVSELLSLLRARGARLRYHGDFDWAGIAMANDLVRRFGVQPWRMAARDYLAARGQLPLQGSPVVALWDPELEPAMRHVGRAVHEESMLPGLVGELLG